jgi:hypothetical protein
VELTRAPRSPAAEALHRLLQRAHGFGDLHRQPVAQQHGRRHHEQVVRRQEPRAGAVFRDDVEIPVVAVVRRARDGVRARAEELEGMAAPRAREQVGVDFAGGQVAPVLVRENAARVVDLPHVVEKCLECRAAAGFVGHPRLFQLEGHDARNRRAGGRGIAAHTKGRDEGGADHRDGDGAPEPQQDLGEEALHSTGASSGVRQNW